MFFIVPAIAIFFFGVGLWQHDWRVIVGAILLFIVGVMLKGEANVHRANRRRRERLDQLRDDEDVEYEGQVVWFPDRDMSDSA